jgi:hypothetical protein
MKLGFIIHHGMIHAEMIPYAKTGTSGITPIAKV